MKVYEMKCRNNFPSILVETSPIVGVGPMKIRNSVDSDGNPAGGYVNGIGLQVEWQDGPTKKLNVDCVGGLDSNGCPHEEYVYTKTGAFVEDLIYAAIKRIEFYQSSKFECEDNAEAIKHLKAALECTQRRHKARVARNVHGEHKV